MASAQDIASAAAAQEIRTRWWLSLPTMLILFFAAIGPLFVVFERDMFHDTLSVADAHLSNLWRSVKLSLITAIVTLTLGFPTVYFIATRAVHRRNIWLLLITIPFWTNLLIRTFAIQEVFRNEGVLNTVLIKLGLIAQTVQIMFTEPAVLLGMVYVYLPLMVLRCMPAFRSSISVWPKPQRIFTPSRGGCCGRSLCPAVSGVSPRDLSADVAGNSGGVHACFRGVA